MTVVEPAPAAASQLPYPPRSQLFHNEEPGRVFREATRDAGPGLERIAVGRGLRRHQ